MSAPRDDSVYIGHIRDACEQIRSYLKGFSEEEFLSTPLIRDAVVRQIQVIGEATKRLSPGFRSATSEIPCSDIAGMRNKVVHDYMGVDLEAVWLTADVDVPELLTQLEQLSDPHDGSNGA